MLMMILRMTGATALYVVLTMLLSRRFRQGGMTLAGKLFIGVIYGLCAVMSTHFGVDYGDMMLNVRDIAPLAAGLFFDPLSGVMAGLIGGFERYIAGTYWNVGAYTRVACSVSTCLAGLMTPLLHVHIFKGRKPSAIYAFFMGAVMEVFHMYVVFITHRNDMSMAFYVVRNCSRPMILFTGLGMALIAVGRKIQDGEWKNPLRRIPREEKTVSHIFQGWLFIVTALVMLASFTLSFAIQTQTALQNARDTLIKVSGDISETYIRLDDTVIKMMEFAEETVLMDARAIAEAVEVAADNGGVDERMLEGMRNIYKLEAVILTDGDGRAIKTAGNAPVYAALLSDVLDGTAASESVVASPSRIAAGSRCLDGMLQAVIDPDTLLERLNVANMSETLSFFHVGNSGSFDIIAHPGYVALGSHMGSTMSPQDYQRLEDIPAETIFNERFFGIAAMCRKLTLDDGVMLLVRLPFDEVYASRDAQAYENGFSAILLFAVVYILISVLVENIVVNNLGRVNASLERITNGDLDEVVNVRSAAEFVTLSEDINKTVTALKGYIEAAQKRIEQELEFARIIQDSALPKRFNYPRSDFEIYAAMDPAREVGGDFYDFFFIDQNQLALVIADVSGKGIPAALFMMRAKTAIRGSAELGMSPSEILSRANNTLCEGNEIEMFVTVWLGIIDLRTGAMRCANAGHEYPAIMRAGGDFELFRDKHSMALAALEGMKFKEYEMKLDPGDRLFVYTDGVPEAIDEQVEQYGTDRMLKSLNAQKDTPLDQLLPAVRQDIEAFAGTAEQFDDITMLGLTYRGQE